MQQKSFQVARGTNDILPDTIQRWNLLEQEARRLFHIYGFQEIRTPFFEETELFARSMGQSSDVVQKQMLNLKAQSQKTEEEQTSLSLRPENTASVVRSYIQNHFDKKEGLSKLFYIGAMFRGERPQKGRLRQFHQMGIEAIGPDGSSPYLDADVISLAIRLLTQFGLNNFKLKINTLGDQKDKENFAENLREQLRSKLSHLCADCQDRFNRNVFRILDCKNPDCRAIVNGLKFDDTYLSQESRQYFSEVKQALDKIGIPYHVDPKLVRGLDYYTHTVFEISDASLGSQDALGAGGRYNSLVAQLGGPDVPAVGFALGMERILLAQGDGTQDTAEEIDVFLIALDPKAFQKGFELVQIIRHAGYSCDLDYRISSMKSQMRSANKLHARYALILGENELAKNVVVLKNMKEGTQEEISLKDPVEVIKKIEKKL
jgi:histidyl-tRNA synthetase